MGRAILHAQRPHPISNLQAFILIPHSGVSCQLIDKTHSASMNNAPGVLFRVWQLLAIPRWLTPHTRANGPPGKLVRSFDPASSVDGATCSAAPRRNGRNPSGGAFIAVGGCARFNTNRALDTNLANELADSNGNVLTPAAQNGGTKVVGGTLTSFNGFKAGCPPLTRRKVACQQRERPRGSSRRIPTIAPP